MTFEEIIERFGARRNGSSWMARCPAHEDRKPSLSIDEGDGKILLHCHAGCTFESICAAKGISTGDLFVDNHQEATRAHTKVKSPGGSADSQPFDGTEADVERMQGGLAKNCEVQEYIESRGISLRVAADLKWGATTAKFKVEDEWVEKLALSVPHYRAGKLVGIKFKSVDGSKLYTQISGSAIDGLYALEYLDPKAAEVLILEGPEDAALAISHGFNAVAINSSGAKALPSDIAALCRHQRIFLLGDQDVKGQKAMATLQQRLPADQVIRVRMALYKDIGELWNAAPAAFPVRFHRILRFAQGSREHLHLEDLLDEDEISETEDVESYAVETLVPCYAISMFFGEEKSGKSLLSRYIGKCVANGLRVFGKYATHKMPVLCLDLEGSQKDIRGYTQHFAALGPLKIRYRTRHTGVPALESPALLQFCEFEHPLVIIDSMTKFLNGADPFHPGQMSTFFDKLLNLCAAGATIFLIHHAIRADVERYADSHQIGANVARSFAVVSEDRPHLNRVRLEGQLFRGSEPVTENLIGFPVISESSMFGLSDDKDPFGPELEKLVEFVKSQPGQACFKNVIKERRGKRAERNLRLLDLAIQRRLLVIGKDRKVAFPNTGTRDGGVLAFPDAGTAGNGEHEN